MILAYIKHFLFFGTKLIATEFLVVKFLIAVLITIISLNIKYNKQLFGETYNKSEEVFKKFRLNNQHEHVLNSLWLFIYFLFVILGILLLRLTNLGKILDLNVIINQWRKFLMQAGWIEIFINLYLITMLLLSLFYFIKKISSFFQKESLKRHIFLMKNDFYFRMTFYSSWFLNYNFYRFLYRFYMQIQRPFLIYFYKEILEIDNYIPEKEYSLLKLRFYIFYYLHYFILLFLIYFDLRYNNLILTKMYIFFPFFFLYHWWIKVSVFYNSKNYYFDRFFSLFFYTKAEISCGRKSEDYSTYFFPFNCETYEWNTHEISQLHNYLKRDLVSSEFKIYGSI